jgi:acetyl esterase/lipase
MATMISEYADAPLLVPNYRLMPKHSVEQALDDCYDAYWWLRRLGYRPNQIVLAGDSAGGYLALALAQRLLDEDEQPAALVGLSPLLQLDKQLKKAHPNIRTDAMFCGPDRQGVRTARTHKAWPASHVDPRVQLGSIAL